MFIRLAFFLLLASAVVQAVAEGVHDEWLGEWKLVKHREGIKVYMSHTEESRLRTFKGIKTMVLPDPYAAAAILNDYAAAPRWIHFVSKMEELGRRSSLDRDLRITTRLPWPVKDREAVIRADITQDPETHDIKISFINNAGLIPPNSRYIRFPEFYGQLGMRYIDPRKVEVTYEVIVDPGGYVPLWLTNIILEEAPFFTLKRFERMLEKPVYHGKYYDYVSVPEE